MSELTAPPVREALHTIREAAARLTLKESTLRKWVLTRRIGVIRLGGAVRIPESAIAELLAHGTRPRREPTRRLARVNAEALPLAAANARLRALGGGRR